MLPETALLSPYCQQEPPFLTDFKGLGSYTIPHVDVQVSGTFQSIPGDALDANYAVTTAVAAQTLGRPLSGNATSATINLLGPGERYGDRINQLDLRVSKILRFSGLRTQFAVDLYNALNSNPIETYNQNFIANGAWLTPTGVLTARFAKVTVQLDF